MDTIAGRRRSRLNLSGYEPPLDKENVETDNIARVGSTNSKVRFLTFNLNFSACLPCPVVLIIFVIDILLELNREKSDQGRIWPNRFNSHVCR